MTQLLTSGFLHCGGFAAGF